MANTWNQSGTTLEHWSLGDYTFDAIVQGLRQNLGTEAILG